MDKTEFLAQLQSGLRGLPAKDVAERVAFYSEMIDDRMEEGLSEAEAVAAVGAPQDIAAQTVADTPLAKIATERMRPRRRLATWEILLLVLGSPLWLSLGVAAAAVVIAVYASLWAVMGSLWAVFGALVGCAIGGVFAGAVLLVEANPLGGLALIGGSMVCAGLAIFAFFGCKQTTRGLVWLTRQSGVRLKRALMRKEAA